MGLSIDDETIFIQNNFSASPKHRWKKTKIPFKNEFCGRSSQFFSCRTNARQSIDSPAKILDQKSPLFCLECPISINNIAMHQHIHLNTCIFSGCFHSEHRCRCPLLRSGPPMLHTPPILVRVCFSLYIYVRIHRCVRACKYTSAYKRVFLCVTTSCSVLLYTIFVSISLVIVNLFAYRSSSFLLRLFPLGHHSGRSTFHDFPLKIVLHGLYASPTYFY